MNDETERILIAQIISDVSIIDQFLITDILFPTDKYKEIFIAILEVRREYSKIDANSIYYRLKDKSPSTALDFISIQPLPPSNAKFYVDQLREEKQARDTQLALMTGAEMLKKKQESATVVASKVMSMLTDAITNEQEEDASIQELAIGYTERLEKKIQDRRNDKLITPQFGIMPLDDLCDQIEGGEMIIIAARPSAGKSALALQFMKHISMVQKIPSMYISLEMKKDEMMNRLVAGEGHVKFSSLRGGYVANHEIDSVQNDIANLYTMPCYLYDHDYDFEKIVARIRRENLVHGVKVAFIDYLGLVTVDMDSGVPRWQQIGEMSRRIKLLAQELNITPVVVNQLRRDAEGQEPTLADLRDSGSIEQDMDRGIFLWTKSVPEDKTQPRIVGVSVAKNRNGPIGKLELAFDGQHMRFFDEKEVIDKKSNR